jgi:hypothetical protein
MKTLGKFIAAAAMMVGASLASAGQLAGKNIILIQGFQPQHVFLSRTHDAGKRFGYLYWNKFSLYNGGNGAIRVANPSATGLIAQNLPVLKDASGSNFNMFDTSKQPVYYSDANAHILHFDSSYRIEGSDGIGKTVANQLKSLFAAKPNFCTSTNGCIVITHSTGDLVMQYIEDNKTSLLDSTTRSRFNVTAYVDLAGARGGTEGATILYELANFLNTLASNTILSPSKQDEVDDINEWLNFFMGSSGVEYMAPGKQFNSGVLYNLQPGVARNIGLSNPGNIPHLRVASGGDELYGFITHLFIKGTDDSVVPLHSSCGSSRANSYSTCTSNRTLDGKVILFGDAPGSLYRLHLPFIQSETIRHNGHQWSDKGNRMTPLRDNGNVRGDLDIQIARRTSYDIFLNKYIRIDAADTKTVGQVLSSSLR